MADILDRIVAVKHRELEVRKRAVSPAVMERRARTATGRPRGFVSALESAVQAGRPGVIAEIKKASPSRGVIRSAFDPKEIAQSYEANGASCLSVLTDEQFFQGHDNYLIEAREASTLPVLRKDFTVDVYQVHEARVLGADCILLIVAILDDVALRTLYASAVGLGIDVLIEVHDGEELGRALALSPTLIGINNRNLRTFETTLETTFELAREIPRQCTIVTESGIHSREDVHAIRSRGIDVFLVGEAFMRAPDPGRKLKELFFED